MKSQKNQTSHFEFIVGLDAFFPVTRVHHGVKQVLGERAGGIVTPLRCKTIEEAKEAANMLWKHEFVGYMKQIWIKQNGEEVAFRSNFEFKWVKKGVFTKVFVSK